MRCGVDVKRLFAGESKNMLAGKGDDNEVLQDVDV